MLPVRALALAAGLVVFANVAAAGVVHVSTTGSDPTTVDNFPSAAKPERYLDGTPIKYRAGRIAIGCATVRRGLRVLVR